MNHIKSYNAVTHKAEEKSLQLTGEFTDSLSNKCKDFNLFYHFVINKSDLEF